MAAFIKQVSFNQSNAPALEDMIGGSVSAIAVESSWVFYIPVRRSGAERSKMDCNTAEKVCYNLKHKIWR